MIKSATKNFKKLTSYHFDINCSKRNVKKIVQISFNDEDFYHLSGLHKLKDIRHLMVGSRIFLNVLADDELCSKIHNSLYFDEIKFRVELIKNLKQILNGEFKLYP